MDAYDEDKRFSGLCVSVPPEYSQLAQYRATLGHKANHGAGGKVRAGVVTVMKLQVAG